MVAIILIFNGFVTLLCLYVAWHIWRLRGILANVADALIAAERTTHQVLQGAPEFISQGQLGSYHLRQKYDHLAVQLQKLQQVLAILGLGQLVIQQYNRNRSLHRSSESKGRQHARFSRKRIAKSLR